MKVSSWFSGSNIIGTQILFWLFVHDIEYWMNKPESINHENTHFKQQKECAELGVVIAAILSLIFGFSILYFIIGVTLFYWLYGENYLINLILYKFDREKAYENIIFEKEAYVNEKDLGYLSTRKRYAFIKWLF
jgi:hypothetical protein